MVAALPCFPQLLSSIVTDCIDVRYHVRYHLRPKVSSLSQEDPLEKGMRAHSSILAWRIPWTEDPGGLQSRGLQTSRNYWATNMHNRGAASLRHWKSRNQRTLRLGKKFAMTNAVYIVCPGRNANISLDINIDERITKWLMLECNQITTTKPDISPTFLPLYRTLTSGWSYREKNKKQETLI